MFFVSPEKAMNDQWWIYSKTIYKVKWLIKSRNLEILSGIFHISIRIYYNRLKDINRNGHSHPNVEGIYCLMVINSLAIPLEWFIIFYISNSMRCDFLLIETDEKPADFYSCLETVIVARWFYLVCFHHFMNRKRKFQIFFNHIRCFFCGSLGFLVYRETI